MWCDEKLELIMGYNPNRGFFGIIGEYSWETCPKLRVLRWHSCREDFHEETDPRNPYFFSPGEHPERDRFLYCVGSSSRIRSVVAFMEKVEEILGLPEKTTFGPTAKSDVIWFRQPAWWRRYNMRRSLYTAFLRTALWYNPKLDNFDYALNRRIYTKATRRAVDRFLAGYTAYKGPRFEGWQTTFQGRSDTRIRSMLRKPKETRRVV